MTTFSTGRIAEHAAAKYLETNGYEIIEQNWRTRFCEIDIVAKKDKCIYFVEVKYRKSSDWGGGLDYITTAKQKQMTFAAEFWVSTNKWEGDYILSALEVAGSDYKVTNFLTTL